MSRFTALCILACVSLAACGKGPAVADPQGDMPTIKLNDAIDSRLGGPGTCVVLTDAVSGEVRYQYGRPSVCMRPLPACATVQIADSLIGLDAGLVTPGTVFKWDGRPQPASIWQKDADMTTAFAQSNPWWFDRLAAQVGADARGRQLKAFGFGLDQGGAAISTREQAGFLQRLYAGRLPVKPQAATAVQALLAADGKAAACDTAAGGARTVGWWLGRLHTDRHDLVVAASIEGEQGLPGAEVRDRIQGALAEAGLAPI